MAIWTLILLVCCELKLCTENIFFVLCELSSCRVNCWIDWGTWKLDGNVIEFHAHSLFSCVFNLPVGNLRHKFGARIAVWYLLHDPNSNLIHVLHTAPVTHSLHRRWLPVEEQLFSVCCLVATATTTAGCIELTSLVCNITSYIHVIFFFNFLFCKVMNSRISFSSPAEFIL